MKKVLIGLLALALAAAAFYMLGYQVAKDGKAGAPSSGAPVSSSSSAAQSATVSSQTASVPASSGAAQGLTKEQAMEKIRAGIPLDWKKYTLQQETAPVKLDGKIYMTFSMWNQDYQEGPLILVDPQTGKLYTHTASDSKLVPAETDPAFDKTERTVTGVIKDGAMMSIVITTPEGVDLTIRRLGVELKNLPKGFIIGNKVKVTYTGVIQGSSMQRAFVKKIEGLS